MPLNSAILKWIGRLLIAASLLAVPLSMSHASMASSSGNHSDVSESKHNQHHTMNMEQQAEPVDASHDGHDSADCCSAICGGALIVETHVNCRLPLVAIKVTHIQQVLADGEWATPHRPPSI